ncbi:MAG: VWA domain-containing protein [Acidobacteriota bacterium]|nr:VWA domain-containing protein [Acidobacteriota bacterium]
MSKGALALACAVLEIAAAQTTHLRISVKLAQIDVKVADSKGNPVPGLTGADFELQVDGKIQKITHCDYISGTAPRQRPPGVPSTAAGIVPAALRPEDVGRTMVIFVDDLSLASESVPAIRAGVRKVIERDMQPGDLTAIIRASAGLGALQDFTTDKEQLLAAAEQIRWIPRGSGGASAYHAIGIDAVRDQGERGLALERTRGETFAVAVADSLRRVIRGMAQLPGRKALVLLSDYMPLGAGEGIQSLPGQGQAVTGDFRNVVLASIGAVVDQAARSGVVIYAVDTRGLNSLNMTAADRYDPYALSVRMDQGTSLELNPIWDRTAPRRAEYVRGQLGSEYLARETGGFMIYEANDIAHAIERAYSDLEGYYALAFTPSEEIFELTRMGEKKYRRIRVRAVKPDLRLRYRTGFYGVPDEETASGPSRGELGLNSALDSPFRAAGVPLDLDCAVLAAAKDHASVHVLLRIDPRNLPLEGPLINRSAIIHLLVRAYDASGAAVEGGIDQRLRVSLNEEGYKRAMKYGLVYATTVTVNKPGPYVVRAALLDEAREERGTANQFVLVPNVAKSRLALSGLMPSASFVKKDDVTPAEKPRTLAPGEHESFAFVVWNAAQKDALRLRMRLVRDGVPVWESPEAPLEARAKSLDGGVVARADLLVPQGTAPGEYQMQVEVRDTSRKGKQPAVAEQWARVGVR